MSEVKQYHEKHRDSDCCVADTVGPRVKAGMNAAKCEDEATQNKELPIAKDIMNNGKRIEGECPNTHQAYGNHYQSRL